MRVFNRVALGLVLAVSAVGLAACGDGDDSSGSSNGDIVIGELITTSGQYGATGELVDNGVKLAVEEINEAGGINGRNLKVQVVDDSGDKPTAIAQFRKMASDDKVMAIIGPNLTINAVATTPLANQFGVISLTPTARGEWPVDMGDWFFRLPPTNTVTNQSLIDQVSEGYDFEKVAILHASDQEVAVSDAKDFKKMLPEAGYDVVADLSFKSTDSDYSAVLTSLERSGAEAVFFSAISTQAGPVLNQAGKVGLGSDTIQWIGSTSLPLPDTITLGGAGAEGVVAPATYFAGADSDEAVAFTEAFRAKYNQDPPDNSALAYDAVYMIAEALKAIDGDITRESLREALGEVEYTGASGVASFPNGSGDAVRGPINLVQIKDGEFVPWVAP